MTTAASPKKKTTAKKVKPPETFYFEGEAGILEIPVCEVENGVSLHGEDSQIIVVQGVSGRRFAKEFLKFAQKVAKYAGVPVK